jgi:hypothetical protein
MLLLATTTAAADGIRYTIRCTEVSAGKSRVLYAANVTGPQATDFDVVLSDDDYSMNAHFVAEGAGPVDLRVRIETRRRAGVSRNGLPLWEEDRQNHRLRVAIGQQIELLPFGKAGPRGLLRLEITPARIASAPVSIAIDTNTAKDAIRVHAYRVPHRYELKARVETPGGVIGNAHATLFANEAQRLALAGALTFEAAPAPALDAWSATLVRFSGRWTGEGVATGRPLRYPVKGPRGEAWTLVVEVSPVQE